MPGHYNGGDASMTQNQGNVLGDRPCVRQSKLYRQHVGGNAMKDLMGQGELKWDLNKLQGGYDGQKVHDPLNEKPTNVQSTNAKPQSAQQQIKQQQPQQQQQEFEPQSVKRGRGVANRQTYNLITGEPM